MRTPRRPDPVALALGVLVGGGIIWGIVYVFTRLGGL